MSLKAFHIVFVLASTLVCLFFAGWSLQHYYSPESAPTDLVMGIGSLVSAIGLLVYGRFVLKKLKRISYL